MYFWYFDKGLNNISLLHLLAKTNSLYIPLRVGITLTHVEFYGRTRGSFMKVTVTIGSFVDIQRQSSLSPMGLLADTEFVCIPFVPSWWAQIKQH
jgi:hypothetical protein